MFYFLFNEGNLPKGKTMCPLSILIGYFMCSMWYKKIFCGLTKYFAKERYQQKVTNKPFS